MTKPQGVASIALNIIESIQELAERGGITKNLAFAAWYAMNFYNIDEDEALELAESDGGNDQGIDMVFYNPINDEIMALQSYFPEKLDKKTPKKKWDAVISSIPYIREPIKLEKSGRYDLAETLLKIKKEHPDSRCVVGLISFGLETNEIINSVKAHESDKSYSDLDFIFLSQKDIERKYKILIEAEDGIPEDTITFSGGHYKDTGSYGKAYIGTVSATELKRLHFAHGDKLFAGNIRLFLGTRKGGINEQIIYTATNEPGNFWALNNGITIVADTINPSKDSQATLNLKRFSIVNGCQTTSCLVRANAPKEAKVVARVIAAKKNIKNEIVRFNNSQNEVKIWTVRAVDDIQEELRKEFRKVEINYAPKQSGARTRRDQDTIVLDKVMQYLAASKNDFILQAINNKRELFDEPYKRIFRPDIKASDVYLAWLIGEMANNVRQEYISELKDDQNSILLGIISRFWIIFITHKLIAKFSKISGKSLSLEKMKTQIFSKALKNYIDAGIDIYYDAAVDTYTRDEFGSPRSALRSTTFLQRIDSKANLRIVRFKKKLGDLNEIIRQIPK